MKNQFSEKMTKLSDTELDKIIQQRNDWQKEAVEAAEQEIVLRKQDNTSNMRSSENQRLNQKDDENISATYAIKNETIVDEILSDGIYLKKEGRRALFATVMMISIFIAIICLIVGIAGDWPVGTWVSIMVVSIILSVIGYFSYRSTENPPPIAGIIKDDGNVHPSGFFVIKNNYDLNVLPAIPQIYITTVLTKNPENKTLKVASIGLEGAINIKLNASVLHRILYIKRNKSLTKLIGTEELPFTAIEEISEVIPLLFPRYICRYKLIYNVPRSTEYSYLFGLVGIAADMIISNHNNNKAVRGFLDGELYSNRRNISFGDFIEAHQWQVELG